MLRYKYHQLNAQVRFTEKQEVQKKLEYYKLVDTRL